MPYCTQSDLESRFGISEILQLTDKDNTGSVNASTLSVAIADADAEINAYLNSFLPLTAVPPNLVRLACVMARKYLYGALVPEVVQADYDEAKRFLTLVAAGKLSLAPDATGYTEVQVANVVQFQNNSVSIFGRRGDF